MRITSSPGTVACQEKLPMIGLFRCQLEKASFDILPAEAPAAQWRAAEFSYFGSKPKLQSIPRGDETVPP